MSEQTYVPSSTLDETRIYDFPGTWYETDDLYVARTRDEIIVLASVASIVVVALGLIVMWSVRVVRGRWS